MTTIGKMTHKRMAGSSTSSAILDARPVQIPSKPCEKHREPTQTIFPDMTKYFSLSFFSFQNTIGAY